MIHLKRQSKEQQFAVLVDPKFPLGKIGCDNQLFAEVSKHDQVTIRKFIGISWELGPEEKISSKEFCLTWRGD